MGDRHAFFPEMRLLLQVECLTFDTISWRLQCEVTWPDSL
jgi:hypothetical protein